MKVKDRRETTALALRYFFLILGILILLLPFMYMLTSSLKTASEATAVPPVLLPSKAQWSNYIYAWNAKPFAVYFRNTFIVCAIVVGVTLIFSIMGAFAFTVYVFPCKQLLFFLFMLTMMVPEELLVIQNYVTVSNLNLIDTYLGIALPSIANGFYIFMLREHFTQMPAALFKAAKVDGCSDWKYLWRVVVPMNKNAIYTIGILSFIGEWNAFMWPNMVTRDDTHRMITSGLVTFRNNTASSYHYLMAASCIVILPIIVLYIVFRKQIISGVADGGIKG